MKQVLATIAFLTLLVSTSADELRIARFDVQRVFDEYQHTKDLKRAIWAKVNVGGPGSYTPSMARRDRLQQRLDDLNAKLKDHPAGTPERARLDHRVEVAKLELQIDELRRMIEHGQEGQRKEAETLRQRAQILGEIWSAAARLGGEQGYRVLVPYNAPQDGLFLTITISGAADDVTDTLLTRLNQQYGAKTPK